jgi:fibronectin type 3 domain-containing protein
VALSWAADQSAAAGYNVYRATNAGGPFTQIYSFDPDTTYNDNAVQAGYTYYYVVTAVGSTGSESGYSNQVQALIPTP